MDIFFSNSSSNGIPQTDKMSCLSGSNPKVALNLREIWSVRQRLPPVRVRPDPQDRVTALFLSSRSIPSFYLFLLSSPSLLCERLLDAREAAGRGAAGGMAPRRHRSSQWPGPGRGRRGSWRGPPRRRRACAGRARQQEEGVSRGSRVCSGRRARASFCSCGSLVSSQLPPLRQGGGGGRAGADGGRGGGGAGRPGLERAGGGGGRAGLERGGGGRAGTEGR